MTKKIFLALAALAALTLSFSSCKKDNQGGNTPTPTDVKLAVNPASLTVMVGKTAALEIKTQPANAEYTCISKDPAIATVDNKGVITGVKVGETKVTVTAGSATKEVAVKVADEKSTTNDRLLGKTLPKELEGVREFIAPFYVPIFKQMKEQEDIVKAANEKEGWHFFLYTGKQEKLNSKAYTCEAPFVGEGENARPKDNRFIGQLVYAYALAKDPVVIAFFRPDIQEIVFDEDPIVDPKSATEQQQKNMNVCMNILVAYGFTESPGLIQYVNEAGENQNLGIAMYNTKLDGGPLQAVISGMEKHDQAGNTRYTLYLEIQQKAPKTQSRSLRTATIERQVRPDYTQFVVR